MPVLTPGHGLPTVIGSDRPCDVDTTLCALRDRLNVLLDGYQTTIDQAVDAVPAARMSRPSAFGAPPPPEGNVLLPFTNVDFDNAGMTNLSFNSHVFTIPKLGRYWMSATLVITTRTGSTVFDQMSISIEGGSYLQGPAVVFPAGIGPGVTMDVKPPGGGNPAVALSISDIRGGFPGDQIALRLLPGTSVGTADVTVIEAQMAVWWHSEFESDV